MPLDGDVQPAAQRLKDLFSLPKWRGFQESIARAMGISLILLDSDWRPAGICNPGHGVLGKIQSVLPRDVAQIKSDWLTDAVRGLDPSSPFALAQDPSGAVVGILPFEQAGVAVSAAWLTDGTHPTAATAEPDRDGVAVLSRDVFVERCESLRGLYGQMMLAAGDSAELGRHAVVRSTVDLLNSLTLKLLAADEFNLDKVLELVANSLVIVLDAPGAWAMSWSPSGGGLAVVSGSARDLLRPLAHQWESVSKLGRCPMPVIESAHRGLLASRSVCDHRHQVPTATLWIGVLQPDDQQTRTSLESLAAPVAIATAVYGLHRVLRRRIGSLLEAITQPLAVTDHAGRLMIANSSARRLFHSMQVDHDPGQPFRSLGLGDAICQGVEHALSGLASDSELEHTHGRALRWKCTPLRDEGDQVSGAMVFLDDITEVHTFRNRARDWEKLIIAGQLAAGMAHEIRSPLAAAMGAIQLIEGGHAEGREDEILGRLGDELARVNRVLSGYLDLGKPGGELHLEKVDVAETLAAIRFLLRSDSIGHGVVLTHSLPEGPVWVTTDASALKQVFINLAKNAVEAMAGAGRGGHLEISLVAIGDRAEIVFTDTGPGIKPELLDQVFRPFFTTKPQGTGLGLAVSREIIERMGGTLVLEKARIRGVRAVVSLPLHRDLEEVQAAGSRQVASQGEAEAWA